MTIFNGKMIDNPDGTTTFVWPDGSVMAHGKVVPMNMAARQAHMKKASSQSNFASHRFGPVDDSIRCLDCEVAPWNGYDKACDA